jgi:acylpyruvate hydrolase
MRLATLRADDGSTTAAVEIEGRWHRLPATDLSMFLAGHSTDRAMALAGGPASGRPWIPVPAAGKIVCCGHNYGDHIAEMGRTPPAFPTLFAKFADTLAGPEDTVRLPPRLDTDWEAELAVVVGREVRRADRSEAAAAIAGYTVANDISVRSWQRRTTQWLQGKAWDRTTPVGPVVVTPDEVDPTAGLDVVCRVGGVTRQRGNTRTLVFDAAALVSYISSFTTLRPGDLVLTGTPGGVGAARSPQVFLEEGDVVETEIPGIGTLRNSIRLSDSEEPSHAPV